VAPHCPRAACAASSASEILDLELDSELQTHLELLTQEKIRSGMSVVEARYAAAASSGGVEQTKENYRRQLGVPFS